MKVYPRSFWTASNPRPVTWGDEFDGLPYFDEPPVGISFHRPEEETLFVYRNPTTELERLRRIAVQGTGKSDINYNYAISQNTEGVYVLRGGISKCEQTKNLRVLLLMGNSEQPTDTLKKNQDDFINSDLSNPAPTCRLSAGDSSVHVFDLIEFLAERGLYKARNDGIYTLLVAHAVQQLQHSMNLKDLDSNYSMRMVTILERKQLVGI